jgi:hypothetical protein
MKVVTLAALALALVGLATLALANPFAKSTQAPKAEVVRECGTGQYGQLPGDWRRGAVAAGPLSLYLFQPLDEIGERPFRPVRPGYYRPFKVLAIVDTNAVVTVVVRDSDTKVVSLLYEKNALGRTSVGRAMRVDEGRFAVMFRSCSGVDQPNTQFGAGGFIVARARCVVLDVWVSGEERPRELRVPFGRRCPAR